MRYLVSICVLGSKYLSFILIVVKLYRRHAIRLIVGFALGRVIALTGGDFFKQLCAPIGWVLNILIIYGLTLF
jgi:hypothetical protein